MMRRRLSALFSCLVVLTFSNPGSRVCDSMAHESGSQTNAHAASGSHKHDGSSSDSHHPSHHGSPLDHCASATSCTGVVVATEVTVESVEFAHSDRVVPAVALAPSSESIDLEPPPPKA